MNNRERSSFLTSVIKLFNKNDLGCLEFKDGELEIKLQKSSPTKEYINQPVIQNPQTPSPQILSPVTHETQNVVTVTDSSADKQHTDYSNHEGAVKSPSVGIVYTKPQPDAEVFITVGSTVKEGDTLFLLEVMKLFTPIRAHKSGVIKEIFVKENSVVEYNEVLAIIE